MSELVVLAAFVLSLIICLLSGMSVLTALVFGLALFFTYGLVKKHSLREMISMALSGVRQVRNILVVFLLIGVITAVWRAGGTIAYIVYHSTRFCDPRFMVLITFLLCCMISMLTGTAFGTAATMGAICVTMANGMGVPVIYTGGAVLAGSFFGDRCSPMSTSALLISELTKTDIYKNIKAMARSAVVPFVLTSIIYAAVGIGYEVQSDVSDMRKVFEETFTLHPAVLIPAAVIVIFSLFKVNVKITMCVSIFCGAMAAVFIQKIEPMQLISAAISGYVPENEAARELLSGGGVVSMVRSFFIVCISSCYSGIFNGTGLLGGVHKLMETAAKKLSPYGGILLSSVITAMISCNQTLAIMLTHQLCGSTEPDRERMALNLENSAVVVSPLVPWSIAAAVPLASAGAPLNSISMAVYLYLLPICCCVAVFFRFKAGDRAIR